MANYKNYDEVFAYVDGVVSGEIVANKYRVKACKRFLKDLKNERYEFNPSDAEFVINIIENTICHLQGEKLDGTPLRGTPFFLLPFHKLIVYNLLGFKIKGTKINRFHEAIIHIPRKNIKTTFVAALSYALGLLYRLSGTKIYVVSESLKQTLETFGFIKYNIRNMGEDDESGGHFHIIDNNNEHSVKAEIAGGYFEVNALASNPDAQDSFNCNIAIADECHAFKKPKQYTLFKDAMKAYTNKLMVGISTAGDNPVGFWANRVAYGKKVLDGRVEDEQLFVFICEADPVKGENGKEYYDYTNPIIHEMANPAYGYSIRPEEILNDSIQAQNDPQLRKDFFAKSLNVFTSAIDTYFDMAEVKASDEKYDWTLKELAKLPITWYGGADLSKLYDLTGTCIHGRYKDIDISISHAFIPVMQAHKKADEDEIPFFWWEEEGWLTMCNSEVIKYDDVVEWFVGMRKMGFKIKWIGYDRRYAREFKLKMKKAGFRMRDQLQRYVEKTEAFREIEKQIKLGRHYYVHNMAYEYCIGNVKAVEDSDDFVRFEKVMPNLRIDLFDADTIATKQMLIDIEKSQHASEWL